MNTAFLLSALGAFLIFGIHIVAGGRENVRPLLRAEELPEPVVMTLYYCWHLTSIMLAAIGGMFLVASLYETQVSLAAVASALYVAFAALSIVLTAAKKLQFAVLPQWVLFLPVAICGIWGLMT